MSVLNLISLLGLLVLGGLAWALGGFRRPVAWRTVLGSGLLMLALGAVVFLLPPIRLVLLQVNDLVVALLGASRAGADFLFGPLALNPGESTSAQEPSVGFIMAAQVLPAVIFFAALMAAFYHLGLIQPVIRLFGRLFKNTLKLSGAEALAGSSNIFVGIESVTTVRPYLAGMTRSELLTLLTCAMSTVASTTLALYVFFLKDAFPQIAGHLISASFLSIPAAALVSKLILAETGQPETMGTLPPIAESERHGNLIAALSAGSWDGLKLAAGIASLLIAILGVVGVLDVVLAKLTSPLAEALGGPLSLERILGWLFTPLAWLLGVESADLQQVAQLLGKRILLTEVVAYQELGDMASAQAVSPRTLLVLSYALCGFAHVASMGIFVGGITALAPSRRNDLSALALRALAGSTLATLMTGALAGLFYHGQSGILGL
ncbi:nucleoside permease nupX [Acidobacteria bacterium AH-259-A15]|nr:nucleoside permease nupX [Acidobacteria bacterium AH-259-A15]